MKNFKRFAKALLTAFMRASAIAFVLSIFVLIVLYNNGEPEDSALLGVFMVQVTVQVMATLVFAMCDGKCNCFGKYPELVGMRERVFRKNNKNSKLFWKGMVFYVEGYLQDALEIFHEIDTEKLKIRDRSELEFYKGRTYDALGFPMNAVKCYETAVEYDYSDKYIYIYIGKAKEASGDFDGAVETYQKLTGKQHLINSIYNYIGLAYVRKGDGKKALEAFQTSVDMKMDYAEALGGMAIAYLLLGDIDKSFEYYEMAIANRINDIDDYKSYYDEMKQVAIAKINKAEQTV